MGVVVDDLGILSFLLSVIILDIVCSPILRYDKDHRHIGNKMSRTGCFRDSQSGSVKAQPGKSNISIVKETHQSLIDTSVPDGVSKFFGEDMQLCVLSFKKWLRYVDQRPIIFRLQAA